MCAAVNRVLQYIVCCTSCAAVHRVLQYIVCCTSCAVHRVLMEHMCSVYLSLEMHYLSTKWSSLVCAEK